METDNFRTSNLQVSAFIIASGINLLRCELVRRGRCEFVFHDPDGKVEQLSFSYFQGALIKALGFSRALAELRAAMDRALGVRQ